MPHYALVFEEDEQKDFLPRVHRFFASQRPYKNEFLTEVRYLRNDAVSLRLTLIRPSTFLEREARRFNASSLFSADFPYPHLPDDFSSVDILLLIDSVVKEIAFRRCGISRGYGLRAAAFHSEDRATCCSLRAFSSFSIPVAPVRTYYGDRVMFYFAWMNHFNYFLVIPSVVGCVLFFQNMVMDYTNDTNPLVPFFSIFMVIWAVLFVKMWERKSNEYCVHFSLNHFIREEPRARFYGERRLNEDDHGWEIYYPEWKRTVKQSCSWGIIMAALMLSVALQVCSLNIQGYMQTDETELLEIQVLDRLSGKGNVFDPHGSYWYVPGILHATLIIVMNALFKRLAEVLSAWENYETEEAFEASLALKRLFFEFINCFATLFYVAFVVMDLPLLRTELSAVFVVDQVRRVLFETIIPFCERRWSQLARLLRICPEKEIPEELLARNDHCDDYLEMVMQFAHITLFAAAFPLCSLFALLCNFIEVRSDLFKFAYVNQRAFPQRAQGIGPWLLPLQLVTVCSVVSNALLFGFTSNQMVIFFPDLFEADGTVQLGDGRFVVAVVFVLEHCLLLVVFLLFWRIPSVPRSVALEIRKRQRRRIDDVRANLVSHSR